MNLLTNQIIPTKIWFEKIHNRSKECKGHLVRNLRHMYPHVTFLRNIFFPLLFLAQLIVAMYLENSLKIKKCLQIQGRNHGENLGSTSAMVGKICPPWLG